MKRGKGAPPSKNGDLKSEPSPIAKVMTERYEQDPLASGAGQAKDSASERSDLALKCLVEGALITWRTAKKHGLIRPPTGPRVKLPPMEGLDWHEIYLTVYEDSDKLRIRVRDYDEIFSFAEIGGMLNRRRRAEPNRLWTNLRILAKREGNISWNENFDPLAYGCTKVAFSQLRKWLRALFELKDDPFEPYHKALRASGRNRGKSGGAKLGAYAAKFHIKSQSAIYYKSEL
jgi:hypothetical protein